MTQPTPAQLDEARALMRTVVERRARLVEAKWQRDAAHALHDSWGKRVRDELDLRKDPGNLANLSGLYHAAPPLTRRYIRSTYRFFLREMIDPLPSIHPGVSKPRPRTVDYAALPILARPYLLGPFLGIQQNGRWAEIDLDNTTDPRNRLVVLQTGGPVDIDLWRSRTADISAWLRGDVLPGTWTVTHHATSTVTLTRQSTLPKVIPFERTHLAAGSLFVGIDVVQRTPVHIPFADLTAGTYIPGASGSGKTSALHILLRSIFANLDLFAAVYLVDGKDGVAMNRYARLHPKVHVLFDEPDVWTLAADLTAVMRERNAEQRALGTDKATSGFIAVVIDELPTFIAEPGKDRKKDHDAFLDNLQKIAMRGRSAGIRMFLITQTPVKEQIPVTLRTNCATTIAFRLPEQSHATSIFGTLDATNDPRKLPTGQAVVWQSESGKLTKVQFPVAPLYQPGVFR